MSDNTTQPDNQTTPESGQSSQLPPALTIQDLTLVLQVFQVASSRGAFKADEMSAVGGLYDRIFKFLEASGALIQQQQPAQATTTSQETSVDETPLAE